MKHAFTGADIIVIPAGIPRTKSSSVYKNKHAHKEQASQA